MEQAGSPLQMELPLRHRRQRKRTVETKRRRWARSTTLVPAGVVQLELVLVVVMPVPAWEDEMPVHRVVPANEAPAPVTRGVRSVWDLATATPIGRVASDSHTAAPYPHIKAQVVRTDGTTRHVGCQYPANRWTPEREEQERIRRAKQRPPKPVKGARTKSRKLVDLVGDD